MGKKILYGILIYCLTFLSLQYAMGRYVDARLKACFHLLRVQRDQIVLHNKAIMDNGEGILYVLDNDKIIRISKAEIDRLKAKKRTALIKFLGADNIGILVTTKPGQENLKQAEKLRDKLTKKGKQAYIFISNNIDIAQFENFNIQSWVNTACSGLAMDNVNIINISDLPK